MKFIRSSFVEPKTGKQVVAFKLAKPLKEFKNAMIYFTFETDQSQSTETVPDEAKEDQKFTTIHIHASFETSKGRFGLGKP